MAGKGDTYRPVCLDLYRANHDRIFKQAKAVKHDAKDASETGGRCPHTVDIEELIRGSDEAEGGE